MRDVVVMVSLYSLLIVVATTSSDLRRIIAYWIIALGFAVHIKMMRKIDPRALEDLEWWQENPAVATVSLIPLVAFHLIAVFAFFPRL